jgi:hypothetical protein
MWHYSVQQKRKGMPTNSGTKPLKLKKGDICMMKAHTSAVCWNDKTEMYLPTSKRQTIMRSKTEMHLNLCALKFTKELADSGNMIV